MVCVIKMLNRCTVLMKIPPIANGAEISMICGGFKIAIIESIAQALRYNFKMTARSSKMKLKYVPIFREFDEDIASRSSICYCGPTPYPYLNWRGASLSLIFLCFVVFDFDERKYYL